MPASTKLKITYQVDENKTSSKSYLSCLKYIG